MSQTTLFRARVPAKRLKNAEAIFASLGMKTSDAFNVFLAQVEIRKDMPFPITTQPSLLSTAQQAKHWEDALGEY